MKRQLIIGMMCLMTLPATFARVAGSSAPVRQPIAEQTARPCLHRAVTGVSEKTLNNFKKKPLQSASQVVPVARVRKAEAATHSLTLNYVTVDDYNLVSVAYALEGDGWVSEDMDGEAQSVYEVPEGKYTVLALFQSGTFGAPVRAVVAENVNVASDCSVELNAAAATELVSFEPLLPDGTPVKSALLDGDGNVIEAGTIYGDDFNGYLSNTIVHRDFGAVYSFEGGREPRFMDGDHVVDIANGASILFNPGVSDRFMVVHAEIPVSADAKDGMVIVAQSNGVGAQTVHNDVANYASTKVADLYDPSGLHVGVDIADSTMQFGFQSLWFGVPTWGVFGEGPLFAGLTNIASCLPDEPADEIPVFRANILADYVCYGPEEEWNGMTLIPTYCLDMPLQTVREGKMRSAVMPIVAGFYNCNLFYREDDLAYDLVLDGMPHFSYDNDMSLQPAGSSTPLIFICDNSMASGGNMSRFSFFWDNIGRAGEAVDFSGIHKEMLNVKYGEKSWSGPFDDEHVESWYAFWEDFNKGLAKFDGKLELNITENGGVYVDNIPCETSAALEIDFSKEDKIAPVTTMVQFRNTDGIVTDRFDTPTDGVLTFAGSDLHSYLRYLYDESGSMYDAWIWYNDEGKPAVSVEYAPLHTGEWMPLEVEEVAENYYMPGYGNFWRGSLKDIDRMALNGWFDLRIKLTDNAGNSQTSTISPAFRIQSLAGVDETSIDNSLLWISGNRAGVSGADDVHFEVFGTDGKCVLTADGSEISLDALPGGIYIVRATTAAATYTKKATVR